MATEDREIVNVVRGMSLKITEIQRPLLDARATDQTRMTAVDTQVLCGIRPVLNDFTR